jgi:predicted SAM-dependent methyltransferase
MGGWLRQRVRARSRLRRMIALAMRPRVTRSYLEAPPPHRLHLGAGPAPIPGWLNTDVAPVSLRITYLDATRRFPFPDASIDLVFSEHMIEHVSYDAGLHMLRECARVLRPGGRVRIATPDVDVILGLQRSELSREQREYVEWFFAQNEMTASARPIFVLNGFFYGWGHRFLYDRRTLRESLERCGFSDVQEHRPGESEHPELRGLERHGSVLGSERWNRFETMVLEARRP